MLITREDRRRVMKVVAQPKDVTKGKKKLEKKKKKLIKVQTNLKTAETKSSTATTNYDEQLEKESRTDRAKGRDTGTTTKKRRKIAKLAHNIVMGAVAVGAGGKYFKALKYNPSAGPAHPIKDIVAPLVTSTVATVEMNEHTRDATIFEPKLKKKQKKARKVKILKSKQKKLTTDTTK